MMRPTALLLSIVALLGVSVSPAIGAPPDRRLEGTLQTIISETPGTDGSQREFRALELPNGLVVELRVSANAQLPPSGSHVAVRGRDDGETFVAAEGGIETLGAVADQTTVPKSSSKKVAVLMLNFVGDTRTPWTRSQVAASFFSDAPSKSVRTFFAEQSYGGTSVSGDVFGYYTIAADRSSCAWSTWHKQGRDAATAAGVDLSDYTNVVAVWPGQSVCGWAGIAYVPGTYSALNNTISWTTAAHELGHNFGAHHASSLRCTEGGVGVPFSSSCSRSEYGDPFDRMGSGQVHFNHYHRRQVGFVSTADQLTVTASGRYTIGVASHATSEGPKIVRVARGDGTYLYLEYRQPFGTFEAFGSTANVTTGVTIRIGPDTLRTQTQLLDMSPTTTTFLDAALQVDQRFTDPASKATIRTTAVRATGATVEIGFPGSTPTPSATPAPTASPVVTPKPTPTPTPTPSTTPVPTAPPSAAPSAAPSSSPTPTPVPPAITPPSVVSSSPANGATNVASGTRPRVTFSEPVTGVSASSVTLVDTRSGALIAGSVAYDALNRTVTFSPWVELRHKWAYQLKLSSAIQDLDGTRLVPWSTRFTVAAASTDRYAGASLTDIGSSEFRAEIGWLLENEVTAGCSPDKFCPRSSVTREQMASFLRRVTGIPTQSSGWFTDVGASMHRGDINGIAAAKIAAGCTDSQYCPRMNVTRGQMASFLSRTLNLPVVARDYFSDDDGTTHETAINSLAAAGITGGCSTGRFCPNAAVTREQMAGFLYRGFSP